MDEKHETKDVNEITAEEREYVQTLIAVGYSGADAERLIITSRPTNAGNEGR